MNLLLSLATGAALVLVFPRFDLTWLAPVVLTPLLVACAREPRWRRRFLDGWASGALYWFFVCIWIQFVLEVHGGMGRWGGWGAFVLFALLKGLHTGLFAALAGVLWRGRWAVPLLAAWWAGVEHVHGTLGLAWLGLGFAWLDLGNAAIDWPLLPRLAPITGVHGISFVLALTAAALAAALLRRSWKQLAPWAAVPLLALLPALPRPEPGREPVQVVQTNVAAETRWTTPDAFEEFQQELAALSLDAPAPLIVWPEAPAPFYPDRPAFGARIANLARTARAYFLLGGVAFTPAGDPLNSAFLLSPEGAIVDRYDKIELVPFGEYVPPAFGWVNRISGEAGDFRPGSRIVVFPAGGRRLGAFICYESAFPGLVRRFTLAGADLLVNLSNDGYFGDSAARQQHLLLVRMRAAENARWILRATNDGITAMIDPAGRITETLPEHQRVSELLHYNPASGLTLYARHGDWFPWSCLTLAVLGCLAPTVAPRRASGSL
jgi:apolipoprotein N-acyltransferase